ncbi:MAG: rRNA maturation RNase YbeY [Pseudomonadota bacterium]
MSEDGPRPSAPRSVAVSALDVEVMRHDGAWTERDVSDASIELAAQAAFTVSLPKRRACYELTIVLTNDAESRDLNRTWRNKDQPTNVLSFPAGDMPETAVLGDVVIAFETTAAEAADKVISLADHVSHLVVHGTLHLLGHDHLDDAEAERMEDLERQALASLGITDPYADDMPARDGNAGLAEIA